MKLGVFCYDSAPLLTRLEENRCIRLQHQGTGRGFRERWDRSGRGLEGKGEWAGVWQG